MKKPLKTLIYLLIVVPILFIGCKKTEMTDESNPNDNTAKKRDAQEAPAYCGSTTTANLYSYGNTVLKYGTLTVANDANNVYVTYTLTGNWTLLPQGVDYYNGCYLFVGSQAELEAKSSDNYNINSSDFTGHFDFLGFNHYIPFATGEKTHMFTIPRSEITVDCPMIVAFAGITNGTDHMYVSARSLLKGSGYWFSHCMQTCSHGSGTAYAFGGTLAQCFIGMTGNDKPNSNNWGWTNKIGAGTYDWPIYAGAGQCDITKGTLVGTLHIVYEPPTATIKYNMAQGVSLNGTHVSVFMDPKMLPVNKKGKYITAPGQFPYTGNPITVSGLSGNIWIAAHSDVSW